MRAVAHIRDGTIKLVSRTGRDVSESYPNPRVLHQLGGNLQVGW